MKPKPHILPTIVLAQFACTATWFAGNAIIDELTLKTGLGPEIIGHVISAVQFGFITGTLVFALLMIADRFSPSKVFFISALLASLCNFALLLDAISTTTLLMARFGTGFFLAGIYPVGMKIASDYYQKGLGKALGFLIGALVLGAAFPYFIAGLEWGTDHITVIQLTSLLAVGGGLAMLLLVPNGPYKKPSPPLQLSSGPMLFKLVGFRKAAFGYFGHMWELYAFWAFVPVALEAFMAEQGVPFSVPWWTFIIIGLGGLSCILGGYGSLRYGSKRVALFSLAISGALCFLSPLLFHLSSTFFLALWCLWGMAVVADSPQFSSLAAMAVPEDLKGTALTLMNCIGFTISIVSIQLLSLLLDKLEVSFLFLILGVGPVLGFLSLSKKAS